MNLEAHLNKVLNDLLSLQDHEVIAKNQLIHSIDLTLLDENASFASLAELRDLAKAHNVAAVCVHVKHLSEFKRSATTHLASVINFPLGEDELLLCLAEIDNAIQCGANEIDYVFPYRVYLDGEQQKALNHADVIIQTCKKYNLTSKIILETGALNDTEIIYKISKELIDLGCDFLKTSTGKIPQGASLSAVFPMLSAIKDSDASCGIKISGGVRTVTQAYQYAGLAELMLQKKINKQWFRLGASSLLQELITS